MFDKNYMTRHPIMIEPHKRIFEAQKIMVENNIRHLPVVGDGKRLLGLVTRQRMQIAPEKLGSLEVWEITLYLAELTVEKIMVKGNDLRVIGPDTTLEEAADLMSRYKIGSLVVEEDGMVAGVITEADLLFALRELLGANEPGWRVTMRMSNETGEGAKLTGAISAQGWEIMAVGSVRAPKQPDHWDMVLKISGCTKDELVHVLEGVEGQQLLDIRKASGHFG